MELILGFILGRAIGAKDGFIVLVLLPLTLALFIGIGFFAFQAADWYESGVALNAGPTAWYAWPWNWPGTQIAHAFLSELFGPNVATPEGQAVPFLGTFSNWYRNVIGALLAISVNTFVAMLPLYVIGVGLRGWAMLKMKEQK